MESEKVFGNPKTIAIRYKFHEGKTDEETGLFACCHLIIDGELIGNRDEICYLKTWVSLLTKQVDFIRKNENTLFPENFKDLTDTEIFEAIAKTNQREEEFAEEYSYLSQLPEEIWQRHTFRLDETVDDYVIYFYVRDSQITFLIDDLSVPEDKGKGIWATKVGYNEFLEATDHIISFLLNKYTYLNN